MSTKYDFIAVAKRCQPKPPGAVAAAELECTVNIAFSFSRPSVHRGDNGVHPNTVLELNMSWGTAQTAFRREDHENHRLHA